MKLLILPASIMIVSFSAALAQAVTINTVPIGNPRNPADMRYANDPLNLHPNGVGSVNYSFRIGKTEVTNAHYVEFLNAVAASDPYSLYSTQMESATIGGIVRSGSPGNYVYSVKSPVVQQGPDDSDYRYDTKPIEVSWFSAIRFANWLHNGRGGPGTTEDGAYTLVGGTSIPSDANSITRNSGARWWLPGEDEWYKAAYYEAETATYFEYATGSNTMPNNNLPASDTRNSANVAIGNFTTGNSEYPLTDAGAYSLSASPNGTLDQLGNVSEWNDTEFLDGFRGVGGGKWSINISLVRHPSGWDFTNASARNVTAGFRIATAIPEPGALLLGAVASVGLLLRRRRWGMEERYSSLISADPD